MSVLDMQAVPARNRKGVGRARSLKVESRALTTTIEIVVDLCPHIREHMSDGKVMEGLTTDCLPIVATYGDKLTLHDLICVRPNSIVGFTKGGYVLGNKLHIIVQPTGLHTRILKSSNVTIRGALQDRKNRSDSRRLRYLVMERALKQ